MTSHCQIPSKIKSHLFTWCLNRANDRGKFDYSGGRKNIVLPSLWFDDMDIEIREVFQNSHLKGTGQKSCSLWSDEALAKYIVNRMEAPDRILLTCYLTTRR